MMLTTFLSPLFLPGLFEGKLSRELLGLSFDIFVSSKPLEFVSGLRTTLLNASLGIGGRYARPVTSRATAKITPSSGTDFAVHSNSRYPPRASR